MSAVRGFQATEADGVWHLYRALKQIEQPKLRAQVIGHILEEESHADIFYSLYKKSSPIPFTRKEGERKDIYPTPVSTWKTISYVHVGEADATQKFAKIQQFVNDESLKSSLEKIVEDECGHISVTQNLCFDLGLPKEKFKKEIAMIKTRRAWEAWKEAGLRIADKVASCMLMLVYFALGLFLVFFSRRSIGKQFVEFDNNHIKGF